MSRKEKERPNIHISERYIELLEEEQLCFPALTKGEIVDNILRAYFSGTAGFMKRSKPPINKIEQELKDWNIFINTLKDTLEEK